MFHTFPRHQYRFPRLPQRLCIRELFQALFKSAQRLLKVTFLGLSVGLAFNLNDPLLLSAGFRKGKQIVDLTVPGDIALPTAEGSVWQESLDLGLADPAHAGPHSALPLSAASLVRIRLRPQQP